MDETEDIRRFLVAAQQAVGPWSREQLESVYGQVWDTDEVSRDFEILGFMAPFVAVRRRSDGKKGSLEFQVHIGHRFYFNFKES